MTISAVRECISQPMSDEPTDAEVIAMVLDGDTEQFGLLVDRYADAFARYATQMTGSADDAADVIQESLVRAFRSLRRCKDPAAFKGWLFRIVSNQCKTHVAKRRRRPMESLDQATQLPAADDASAHAETAETRRHIRQALYDLPGEQRELLVLRYVEGLSIQEIAVSLAIGMSAVKMRLMRARRELLSRLEGQPA